MNTKRNATQAHRAEAAMRVAQAAFMVAAAESRYADTDAACREHMFEIERLFEKVQRALREVQTG